jgi:hypothetical protein
MTSTSLENGLSIQEHQLKAWKIRLSTECYKDLVAHAKERNEELKKLKMPSLYHVFRGDQITTFVIKWLPKSIRRKSQK